MNLAPFPLRHQAESESLTPICWPASQWGTLGNEVNPMSRQ